MNKLDSRLPVVLLADGVLAIPDKKLQRISVKKLGHLIREGFSIYVYKNLEDGSRADLTNEYLVRVAMFDYPGDHEKKVQAVVAALQVAQELSSSESLLEDTLYFIIENGGLKEYLKRKGKGMVCYE